MQNEIPFSLPDVEATLKLGRALAHLALHSDLSVLLLQGDLGAGKTTLVRGLVLALPGGKTAEVASPSFTICNLYSTNPPIHHYDLYRLEPFVTDERLEESLEDPVVLTIVEWSEHLSLHALPAMTLLVHLAETKDRTTGQSARLANCSVPIAGGEVLLPLLCDGWVHDKAVEAIECPGLDTPYKTQR
jgi:ATPase, YjeE family